MKKGFTLVEVLAVIIILALIALITVPLVNNAMKDARKGTFESSAYSIIKAMKIYASNEELRTGKSAVNLIVDVESGKLDLEGATANFKGKAMINSEGEVLLEVNNGTYCARKLEGAEKVTVTEIGNESCDGSDFYAGSSITYVAPSLTDTHLGILYMDPTQLKRTCTEEEVNANKGGQNASGTATLNGTKSGCMKWYIYKENADGTVQAILDHNTTPLTAYDFEYSATKPIDSSLGTGEYEAVWQLEQDTELWNSVLDARIPTAFEIAELTGISNFEQYTAPISSFSSNYDWLYLNLDDSPTAYRDSNSYSYTYYESGAFHTGSHSISGYWLSTPSMQTYQQMWLIFCTPSRGELYKRDMNVANRYGIRPVVTVPTFYINR